MKKSNTFVYELDGNLYINLTNRCSNACSFCVRNDKESYFGNALWLEHEPSAAEVIEACKYIGVKPDLYDPIEEDVKAYLRGE